MSIDFADGPVTNQSWLAGAVPVGAIIQATDEHIGKQHVHQVVPDIRWWFGFLKINKNSTYTCLQVGWSTILLVHIFAFKNDALNIAYTIYILHLNLNLHLAFLQWEVWKCLEFCLTHPVSYHLVFHCQHPWSWLSEIETKYQSHQNAQ